MQYPREPKYSGHYSGMCAWVTLKPNINANKRSK